MCQLINSCCATGATIASDTTASASAKIPNFRIGFPSAFVVVAAQLNDMSSMSSSMLSDQFPLTLSTVPAAKPTENDFIDKYDLDGNDNGYSLSEFFHFLRGYTAPEHWLACLQSCFGLSCWLENQQSCIYEQNSKRDGLSIGTLSRQLQH